MKSLLKNGTWDLVPFKPGMKTLKCRWLFKLKSPLKKERKVTYKARLVAKGFTQVEGVDYAEIFAPVVRHTTIRVLLALVAYEDLELHQLDVKTAFLHGDLEEELFMDRSLDNYMETRVGRF